MLLVCHVPSREEEGSGTSRSPSCHGDAAAGLDATAWPTAAVTHTAAGPDHMSLRQ